VLGGHRLPGGTDISGSANNFGLNATTCTMPANIALNWGEVVLKWFIDHPKRGAAGSGRNVTSLSAERRCKVRSATRVPSPGPR